MSSSDDYENTFLEKLFELNFSNLVKRKLDVVLVNTLNPIISCDLDHNLFFLKTPQITDLALITTPICTLSSTCIHALISTRSIKFDFRKANWKNVNEQTTRYNNVNVLVQEWYKWIKNILEANIPKVTRRRASLSPCVASSTSHLIKKLETKKKRWQKNKSEQAP